jgi:hypothetical protein
LTAAATGFAAYSINSDEYVCPKPSAASVEMLFAPCQAFATAIGHPVTRHEAVEMGLLKPNNQPPAEPTLEERQISPAQLIAQEHRLFSDEHSTVGQGR